MRSTFEMAKLIILSNGRCDLRFQGKPMKFNRVEKFNYKKNFFKFYIDKNDSVYDITLSNVVSWKTVEKGKSKFNVPDKIEEYRDKRFFDKVKGNPTKIAISKVIAELDAEEMIA